MHSDEKWKQQIGERVAKRTAGHIAGHIAKVVAAVVGGAFLAVFLGFLLGWLIQFLWNATLVAMFGWPTIGFWQAVGLFILAKLLVGFGGSGWHHKSKRHRHEDRERMRAMWRRHSATAPDSEPDVTNSDLFKHYWQEEGKAAYEAYVASREGKGKQGE